MFDGRGADERVVHRSSGDAELAKPGQQIDGGVITKETRRGKVVRYESGDRPREPRRIIPERSGRRRIAGSSLAAERREFGRLAGGGVLEREGRLGGRGDREKQQKGRQRVF